MINRNKKTGFTLIELLVVVAIISLLSTIMLAGLNESKKRSRDSQRLQTMKQVQTALELYITENGSYPTVSKTNANFSSGMETVLTGFLADVVEDPIGLNRAYYGPSDLWFSGCGEINIDTNNPVIYDYLLVFETEGTLSETIPVWSVMNILITTVSGEGMGTGMKCLTNK